MPGDLTRTQRHAGDKPGGFLTGLKGIALLVLGIIVAIVIVVTGIMGSQNTFPRLQEASTQFIGGNSALLHLPLAVAVACIGCKSVLWRANV